MGLSDLKRPLLMIGCGTMAGAILVRWLAAGLDPAVVSVVDPGRLSPPAPGVTLLPALPDALPEETIVLLGVKPQSLPEVAPKIAPLLNGGHLVISMLAGVTLANLSTALGEVAQIVRIMPNTPVALGKGVCAYYADPEGDGDAVAVVMRLLSPLGLLERIADETQFNLVTALTGCGPAFVFRFIDALAQGASALGLERNQALRLALATVEGASALAAQAGEHPAILADKVASKGGMTREGLDVLDEGGRFNSLIAAMMYAARDPGEELERLSAG